MQSTRGRTTGASSKSRLHGKRLTAKQRQRRKPNGISVLDLLMPNPQSSQLRRAAPATSTRAGAQPAPKPPAPVSRSWWRRALDRLERYLRWHRGEAVCVWLLPFVLLINSCTTLTPPGQARMVNPYSELPQSLLNGPSSPVPLLRQSDPKNSSETGRKMPPDVAPTGASSIH